MVKFHYPVKEFLACRLAGCSMQLFQLEYLMHKIGVFVINDEVLVGSVASCEHRGHKVKDVLGSPHRADGNVGGQLH